MEGVKRELEAIRAINLDRSQQLVKVYDKLEGVFAETEQRLLKLMADLRAIRADCRARAKQTSRDIQFLKHLRKEDGLLN